MGQKRGIVALFTAVIIGLVLVLNILVSAVVDKYNVKLDMTGNALYELGEKTERIAEDLTQDVTITVFNAKEEFLTVINEYLARYDQLSPHIVVQYVDPYRNPNVVEAYKERGIIIAVNSILVECGGRYQYLTLTDLYSMNIETKEIYGIQAEQKLTSAVLYVAGGDLPTAAFSSGHDEKPSQSLVNIFDNSNFIISNVSLEVQDIPEDCSIFVIASPTRDFSSLELNKLDAFLASGGKLMVFLAPSAEPLANLEGFLSEWGIGVEPQVVLEKNLYVGDNPLFIHGEYVAHSINSYFQDNRYYVVMPASRALSALFNTKNGIIVEGLLSSSPDSYGKTGTSFQTLMEEEGDVGGPFYLALTARKPLQLASAQETIEARVIAIGSKDMYSDDVLSVNTYANGDFLSQCINWLYQHEVSVSIPMKSLTSEPLSILNNQAVFLSIFFTAVIPGGIFLYGVIIYIRRRYL